MLENKRLDQTAGNGSNNLQAGRDIVQNGISYNDARQIAIDVFKANILDFQSQALVTANERAEYIIDVFIEKLKEVNSNLFSELRDPAVQNALFEIQRAHAIQGDCDLADVLMNILIERIQKPKRNTLQILLDEAIKQVQKLTVKQIHAITLIFAVKLIKPSPVATFDALADCLERAYIPFSEEIIEKDYVLRHLEYVGCGKLRGPMNFDLLQDQIKASYSELFFQGFTIEEFEAAVGESEIFRSIIDPMITAGKAYFIEYNNRHNEKSVSEALSSQMRQLNIPQNQSNRFYEFLNSRMMPADEIKDLLIERNGNFQKVFDAYNSTSLRRLELSNLGIVIACINFNRVADSALNIEDILNGSNEF